MVLLLIMSCVYNRKLDKQLLIPFLRKVESNSYLSDFDMQFPKQANKAVCVYRLGIIQLPGGGKFHSTDRIPFQPPK